MEKAETIIIGNKKHRPLLDETVTDEDWKKAEIELNETSKTRNAALQTLKNLIENQSEFTARTDDIYLLRFLRARKFNVEKAFKLLRDHYLYRAQNPDFFPSPSGIEKALRYNIFNYMPHRDSEGRAMYIIKLSNWNTDKVSFAEFVAAGNLLSEYVLDNPVTQINGYIGIWDFKGFSWKQFMTLCKPKHLMLLSCLIQDRFPGRFKVAYGINVASLVITFHNLFKPFLKEKFRQRVMPLTNCEALFAYVDPAVLPKDFEGDMPSLNCTEILQRVLDNEPNINYNRKFGFNRDDISCDITDDITEIKL